MEFFVHSAWLIPLFPLAAFLCIAMMRQFGLNPNRLVSTSLTVGSTALGLIWSTAILLWSLADPHATYEKNVLWLSAGPLQFSLGILIDHMSVMLLMVVTTVSILVQIYTYSYMHDDDGFHRFFALLALFNFSMLGLVLSTNLFQMYIFWELVGVSSYLLIGFWYRRPSAAAAASKAFIMNRIGDFGFLVGTIAFLYFSLDWWKAQSGVFLAFSSLPGAAEHVHSVTSPAIFVCIGIAIFMGAMAKSAQFPLHTWLPDAMEGPTPISALIHAATMVAAGVYLIGRAFPIFELSPTVTTFIAYIGCITAVITTTIAFTQQDIKRILAYSTCSQLGFMVMAMGAGIVTGGLFHLFTHAYFKAMLFLCSGAVIHSIAGEQNVMKMGGLRKKMPVVAYTYLIGAFAISGILLSGFWSKEEIFNGFASKKMWPLLIAGLCVSGMTTFYMFRSYFLVFEGEYRGDAHAHKPDKVLSGPLIVLAVPSIVIGFLLSGLLKGAGIGSFAGFLNPHETLEHGSLVITVVSLAIGLCSCTLAAMFYWKPMKVFDADKLREKITIIYKISFNKWYFDEVYGAFVRFGYMPVSATLAWIDKYCVDGIANLIGWKVRIASRIVRTAQNGNVQAYAAWLLGGGVVASFVAIILL